MLLSLTPVMLSPLAVTKPLCANAVPLRLASVPYALPLLLAVMVSVALWTVWLAVLLVLPENLPSPL